MPVLPQQVNLLVKTSTSGVNLGQVTGAIITKIPKTHDQADAAFAWLWFAGEIFTTSTQSISELR